jgi:hypothetical protein
MPRHCRLAADKFLADGLLQIGRERLAFHHGADFRAHSGQGADIVHVQSGQLGEILPARPSKARNSRKA